MSTLTVRPTFKADPDCDHPPWAWLIISGPAEEIRVQCTLCGAVPALSDPEEVPR